MESRPPTSSIPDAPGSYQFVDGEGRIVYVGKAKSLRSRLTSYFQDPAVLPPRTAQMVRTAERVEWTVVSTEVEALMLEYTLIQLHHPRFNVRLKDDKSYPWLAVTVNETWPRPAVVRGRKRKGVRYFGPYGHVGAIRATLDLLVRSFPVRTCSDVKFRRHERLGRPCLLYDIERCSGPCIGAVTPEAYAAHVDGLVRFLSGRTGPVLEELRRDMDDAAERLEYERAARLRDRIEAVRKAGESQQVVSERSEDFDVVGVAEDDLEAAVQVFHVRHGRVVGRGGYVADKVEDLTPGEFAARVVEEVYGPTDTEVPGTVFLPDVPDGALVLQAWLAARRGGPVRLAVPRRGAKKALSDLVVRNAAEDLARHRMRRAADHNSRARALTELQELLGLAQAPLRIECYDMSHLQGSDYVGSMVVFEDGLAKTSDYRRFVVTSVPGNDDYAAMEEVLTRRLRALVGARDGGGGAGDGQGHQGTARTPARRSFAYPPHLLLLDGGKGQLGVGVRVVEALGLAGTIELASLAKQFEEVYRPGRPRPVTVPRGSEALYLLQRVRDEAHRFAVTFHRQRRGARMTAGLLDGVPGLGPARRKRLEAAFGGVAGVRSADRTELRSLSFLPDPVADAVFDRLHPPVRRAVGASGPPVGETGGR